MKVIVPRTMPSLKAIYILDAIGPFFRAVPNGRINWSKIPFSHLEQDGHVRMELFETIRDDFRTVCTKAVEYGFNAISIDDLAHLVPHATYPPDLQQRIRDYRSVFGELFDIAQGMGLDIYLTTDIMFFNDTLIKELGRDHQKIIRFLRTAINQLFIDFPQISGILSRVGETDGLDVEGDFRSQLTIQSPRHAHRFLDGLLPVFEQHDKRWIFRTWSVGAYSIGDLSWNRDTLEKTFRNIDSKHLIISHKYGETDFFRYLKLNKQFFRGSLPNIIELQTRREYEGAGQYPSFIGYDYEAYRNQLSESPALSGAMVWCQTGGWIKFRRLSFLDPAAVWNEINTWVAIRIFKDGMDVEGAVEGWRRAYAPHMDKDKLLRFLSLSSDVVKRLLYIEEYAQQKVFFRRLRIPPQLSVFWDHVIINHSMRKLLRHFVRDGEAMIKQAQDALRQIEEMKELAADLALPQDDIAFMYDTFEILAVAREYYFRDYSPDLVKRIEALRSAYRERYDVRYSINIDFKPITLKRQRLSSFLNILLRNKRGYRLTDHVFTIRILSWIYPWLLKRGSKILPDFSKKQAMGVDSVFR